MKGADEVIAKTILNRHKRDRWFLDEYSINPYRGCAFNCLYCYIRGSKYGGEGGSKAKINAPVILEKEIKRRAERKEYGVIAISTSTEPYQQAEKRFGLTRKILEIILKYRFPVHILTKSTLVLRDMDLLAEIDSNAILPEDLKGKIRGAIINFSISTLNEKIAKMVEPGAPPPSRRLETLQKFSDNDFLTGISYIPLLPYISDSQEEMENMVRVAMEYGAHFVFFGTLTLFGSKPKDSRMLYYRFLEKHHPEILSAYKKLYLTNYPTRDYEKKILKRGKMLCRKYGIKNGII